MTNDRDDLAHLVGEALNQIPEVPSSTAIPIMPGPGGEHDDRFPDVHLLWIDDQGEDKRTARRKADGWQVTEWAVFHHPVDGSRAWSPTWSFHISDADLNNLVALSATT